MELSVVFDGCRLGSQSTKANELFEREEKFMDVVSGID